MGVFGRSLSHSGADVTSGRLIDSWRDVWTSVSVRLRRNVSGTSRLALLERITIAPRQMVALIEVEGEKVLVGTSHDGAPRFLRLNAGNEGREIERRRIPFEGTVA